MRAVVQRVKEAWVRVDGEEVARIGAGLLILVGVAAADGPEDVAFLAQKLAHLRVFAGDGRLMHLSLLDLKAEVLLVSQFTILGDCRKGRRPSFDGAATPETGGEALRGPGPGYVRLRPQGGHRPLSPDDGRGSHQ